MSENIEMEQHGSLPKQSEGMMNLGRLIASENSASDVLAWLVELDSSPAAELFNLDPSKSYSAIREMRTSNGRIDFVIVEKINASPLVVMELKGASSLHNDQMKRYETWATSFDFAPQLVVGAFDEDEIELTEAWTAIRLRDLFSAWTRSQHSHASWLARQVTDLLDKWDREADRQLGERTGYYVPDIVSKRLARDLRPVLGSAVPSASGAWATRDNAGSPMVVAWAAHPRDPEDQSVWVGADLRSPTRRSSTKICKLRPCVEVETIKGSRNVAVSRSLSFDLARRIHAAMSCSSVRGQLLKLGHHRLAEAISSGPHDGFAKSIDGFDFFSWSDRIETEANYPGPGVFRHDWGRRLSTIIDLDTTNLTRSDIEMIMSTIVEYLYSESQAALECDNDQNERSQ